MSSSVASISIKKKITAFFADGSHRQNLGIPTVLELIRDQTNEVPVMVDAEIPHAQELFDTLTTQAADWKVSRLNGQYVLTRPGQTAQTLELRETPEEVAPAPQASNAPAEVANAPAEVANAPAEVAPKVTTTSGATPTKKPKPYIILGPQDVFTNAPAALNEVRRTMGNQPLPTNYHNQLTQTFLSGHLEGQVRSLFRDLKKHGFNLIRPKLEAFVNYLGDKASRQEATGGQSDTHTYMMWIEKGLAPHDAETFVDERVNMSFFKCWAIVQLVREAQGR